jgi:hypothetical protein
MQSIPEADPNVVASTLPNGEMVLLQLDTKQYYSLNQTGALIWKHMDHSATLAVMSQTLVEQFDVTAEAAGEAVRELIEDLKSHKLIVLRESRIETL